MKSTLSQRLEEARGLLDIVLPKPGQGQKTDFVVLNSGNDVVVRCLNDRHYSFRTKVAKGFEANFAISDAECVISLPSNIGTIEVRSNLEHDKVVMLEIGGRNPACNCGQCNTLTVRLPSIRTGFVTNLDQPISSMQPFNLGELLPAGGFMGGSPFGDMFGGGVRVVNLGDLMSGGEGDLGKMLDESGLGLLLNRLGRGRRAENGSGHPGHNGNGRRETTGSGAKS